MGTRLVITLMLLVAATSCRDANPPATDYQLRKSMQLTAIREYAASHFKEIYRENSTTDSQYLDSDRCFKEIVVYPGGFKFRYYRFDETFRYSPFVITASNAGDSVISYFTFTDELFYLYNENHAIINPGDNTIAFEKREPGRFPGEIYINLEKNLNKMIHDLHFQNDLSQILLLMQVIFTDLLQMAPAERCEVERIQSVLASINSKSQELKSLKDEYSELIAGPSSQYTLTAEANEAEPGYWQFKIVEVNGIFSVRAKFIGDLIVSNVYL